MQKLRYNKTSASSDFITIKDEEFKKELPQAEGGFNFGKTEVEIAEKFILFLKSEAGRARKKAGLSLTPNNLNAAQIELIELNENKKRTGNDYAFLKRAGEVKKVEDESIEFKNKEAEKKIDLKAVLNKALSGDGDEEDAEERIASAWRQNIKSAQAELAGAVGQKRVKPGNIKFFLHHNELALLPKEKKPLLFAPLAKLSLPAGMLIWIITAFWFSVFFNISAPAVMKKIVAFTDKIYEIPKAKFYELAYLPEYRIDEEFFKKTDKIIANSVNLKSRFIERNQEILAEAQNKSKFLITKDELLGLPAGAAGGAGETQANERVWQEKFDVALMEISQTAEKIYNYIKNIME